ncbi:enoyl-CoA hydratase-related protein [Pseudonocardia sp. KRD291]|uniref:enoyl-CoA hydratase-related protein n=1 Tax=Pseudonocardia sp. KRD291 TaxID=2792007 RepID=UPI001C49F371|nr:enoyl-CoA hydratase-related protein [Pseudonocardia sp. KRD291]MBW0101863.1 enoyl-CoA hydratase/isomerase family protein [Pseudonocardia sp. KRD291]
MKPEEFSDTTYEVDNGLAWITINRPDRYDAFRAQTVDELVHAFELAWADDEAGVVALTGAGEKAFCTGGDQKGRTLSPTALKALKVLKQSFNSDTEHFSGTEQMTYSGLKLFGESAEAQEGIAAFNEKRVPESSPYRTH